MRLIINQSINQSINQLSSSASAQQIGENKQLNASTPISLKDLSEIRIVINKGRGFGHQRAAITTMQRLRELGFSGRFDVRYDENYFRNKDEGDVGRRLETFLPGFKPTALKNADSGQEYSHPTLGKMTITRLPNIISDIDDPYNLPYCELTISGANDINFPEKERAFYNTNMFVQLQPTDWYEGSRYIVSNNNKQDLPRNIRLSVFSLNETQQPIKMSPQMIAILDICANKNVNTQLVYGLYPEETLNPFTKQWEATGSLSPTIECERLIEAHQLLQKNNGKSTIIFLPQDFCKGRDFQKFIENNNLLWMDLTSTAHIDSNKLPANKIIMAYTGTLPSQFFDQLMLEKTTFPPVIEGCNSRETCESLGRPFIHGGAKNEPLITYEIDQKLESAQQLHASASRCLEKGTENDVVALAEYMSQSASSQLNEYHAARRNAFMDRPEACQYALNSLSIQTNEKSIVNQDQLDNNNSNNVSSCQFRS